LLLRHYIDHFIVKPKPFTPSFDIREIVSTVRVSVVKQYRMQLVLSSLRWFLKVRGKLENLLKFKPVIYFDIAI
jgi:hypothetical protein